MASTVAGVAWRGPQVRCGRDGEEEVVAAEIPAEDETLQKQDQE